MASVIVDIRIPAEDYLRFYSGSVNQVVTTSRDGRRVRFPAEILRRFVTHNGIDGSFEILFDSQGKFVSVERLGLDHSGDL